MMRARELARLLGMRMRIEILWATHALSLRFADTSALLLWQRGTVLPVPTTPGSDAFLFAREHAEKSGWVDLWGRNDWPVPEPGERGDWLAAPASALASLRWQILDKATIEQIPGSALPRGELDAALEQFHPHGDVELDLPRLRLAVQSQRVFLILTERCVAKDVPQLEKQLSLLKTRHLQAPSTQVLYFDTQTGMLRSLSFKWLEARLQEGLRKMRARRASSPSVSAVPAVNDPITIIEVGDHSEPSETNPPEDDYDLKP